MTGVRGNCTLKVECLVPVVAELQLLNIPSEPSVLSGVEVSVVHIVNQAVDPYIPWVTVHPVKTEEHDAVGYLLADTFHIKQFLLGLSIIKIWEALPHCIALAAQPFDIRLSISKRSNRQV